MPQANFDDALALVTEKFNGVTDKDGQPYVLHCLRVAIAQSNETARLAALMHDLVEDTDVTLDDLRHRGFSEEVISTVELLTHRPHESYCDYVLRLSISEIAVSVKLADLNDNYRLERVAYRLEQRQQDARRLQRYILTYQFLTGRIDRSQYAAVMTEFE